MTHWVRMGYAVLPRENAEKKSPCRKFGHLSTAKIEDALTILKGWGLELDSDHGGLLLMDALPGTGAPHLSVIDQDDLSDETLAWIKATFPGTPLTVRSGRDGGGVHYYYRAESGKIGGSAKIDGLHKVDHRGHHNIVVLPGSLHKTGRAYQACWNGQPIDWKDITLDMLRSLPVLPDSTLAQCRVAKQQSHLLGFVNLGLGKKSGNTVVVRGDDTASPRHGVWAGQTLASIARSIGDGETRIACPHDDHKSDSNGGTAMQLTIRGGLAQHGFCHACGLFYKYQGSTETKMEQKFDLEYILNDLFHSSERGLRSESKLDLDSDGWITRDSLARACKGHSVKLINAGLSSKKTTRVAEALLEARKNHNLRVAAGLSSKMPRVIVVSPSQALTRAASARFEIPCYHDATAQWITGDIAICAPSLWRAEAHQAMYRDLMAVKEDFSVIVLDEAEQTLRMLASPEIYSDQAAQSAFWTLVMACRHADEVVLLDGTTGPATQLFLQYVGRPYVVATAPRKAVDPVRVHGPNATNKASFYARLDACMDAGEVVAFACMSKAEAEAAYARYQAKYPAKNIACVVGASVHEYDLADPHWADSFDLLIYNMTMGSGVDIHIPNRFNRRFLLANDGVGTISDLKQLIARVRNPIDRTIEFCTVLSNFPAPHAWEYNEDQVLAMWRARDAETRKLCGGREYPDYVVTFDGGTNPDTDKYVRLMACIHASTRRDGWEAAGTEWLAEMRRSGADVTWVDDTTANGEDIPASLREAKKAARKAEDAAVVEVILPDVDQVAKLRKAKVHTKEEAIILRASALAEFYGDHGASTVAFDERGKGRAKVRTYAHVCNLGAASAIDRKEDDGMVSIARRRHRAVEANLISGVLAHLGIDPQAQGKQAIDPERVREIEQYVKKNRRTFDLLGIKIPTTWDNPQRFVSGLLDRMGAEVTSKQIRNGDDRGKRSYFVSFDRVAAYAGHYAAKIGGGVVAAIEDEIDVISLVPAANDRDLLDYVLSA